MPAISKMSDSTAFETKLDKLNADLNIKNKTKSAKNESYAMWMNYDCETQKKSSRIVRFIKSVVSYILPISFFEPIKASKVALRFLQLVEKNQEYLKSPEIVEKAKNVLKTLNARTESKYAVKIEVCILAIDGLAPKAPATEATPTMVMDFLNKMDYNQRTAWFRLNQLLNEPPATPPPAIPSPAKEPAPQPASPKTPTNRPLPTLPKTPVTPAAKKTAPAPSPAKTPVAAPKAPPAPAKTPAAAPERPPASPITAGALEAEIARRAALSKKMPVSVQNGIANGKFLASGPWDERK